jgi:uncharacterized protein
MQIVRIVNQTHPVKKPIKAEYCDSFMGRLRGLMFRKSLTPHEGLLMVQPSASRIDASIHMFFMNFDIATVWLDPQLRVVDVRLARRWRPAYFPAGPAKYILEAHPDRLADFHPGDQVALEPCA